MEFCEPVRCSTTAVSPSTTSDREVLNRLAGFDGSSQPLRLEAASSPRRTRRPIFVLPLATSIKTQPHGADCSAWSAPLEARKFRISAVCLWRVSLLRRYLYLGKIRELIWELTKSRTIAAKGSRVCRARPTFSAALPPIESFLHGRQESHSGQDRMALKLSSCQPSRMDTSRCAAPQFGASWLRCAAPRRRSQAALVRRTLRGAHKGLVQKGPKMRLQPRRNCAAVEIAAIRELIWGPTNGLAVNGREH